MTKITESIDKYIKSYNYIQKVYVKVIYEHVKERHKNYSLKYLN